MYVSMHVLICQLKEHLQVFITNKKNRYNTMQYSFKVIRVKRKTPLVTVAGVALKSQADLISTMVRLEVMV